MAAIRVAAIAHPSGPLFAQDGVGNARWRVIAHQRGLPIHCGNVRIALAARGTTPVALIRLTLGREALTRGRVRKVESRKEAVWVLSQAILDGFRFDAGWTVRIQSFGKDKPYPVYLVARPGVGEQVQRRRPGRADRRGASDGCDGRVSKGNRGHGGFS